MSPSSPSHRPTLHLFNLNSNQQSTPLTQLMDRTNKADCTPVVAGSIAGVVNWLTQYTIHNSTNFSTNSSNSTILSLFRRNKTTTNLAEQEALAWKAAACPTPQLTRTIATIAIYFTSYEYLKTVLSVGSGQRGYSQHVKHEVRHGDHTHTTLESHINCRGPFTVDKTAMYFAAAALSGGLASASSMKIGRLMMMMNRSTANSIPIASSQCAPRMTNIATVSAVSLQSIRFGLQFAVFEQVKNYCAQYRQPNEELSVGEVWSSAMVGGFVAVSAIQPIQRLLAQRLPCPLPSSLTSTMVPKCPLSTQSYRRALTRFLPICVLTAVTFEFTMRAVRTLRDQYVLTHPNETLFSFAYAHAQSGHQNNTKALSAKPTLSPDAPWSN